MTYQLEIILLSAASPGSGEGWAGMIDSDIVFDEFGLPFIPAKRLRGLLRESAEDVIHALAASQGENAILKREEVSTLFGDSGQAMSSPLRMSNAYLEEHDGIRQWLQWARANYDGLLTPDRVIATFTHLRQQTAIGAKNGVAEEGSLRTTRVLNRGLQFFSAITLESEEEKLQSLLELATCVTRRLGSKRNRGLGSVRCFLRSV